MTHAQKRITSDLSSKTLVSGQGKKIMADGLNQIGVLGKPEVIRYGR